MNYSKGEKIKSLDEMMRQDFVFLNNKIEPKGFFQNWSLHVSERFLKLGIICKAEKCNLCPGMGNHSKAIIIDELDGESNE